MSEQEEAGRGRRQSPRVAAMFKVEYQSFDEFLVEYAEDISQGGIFLATDFALPLGTVVRLQIHLPDSPEKVQVIGQVVHHRGAEEARRSGKRPGMGVEFLEIGDPALARVRAFVSSRLERPPDGPGADDEPRTGAEKPVDVILAFSEPKMGRLVARALGPEFSPRPVDSGLRALSECIHSTPRLVVAAADLPGFGGLDLLRIMRQRSTLANVPFIVVGTLMDEAARLAAFRGGADDVFLWPLAEAEVRARVDRLLRRVVSSGGLGDRRALRGEIEQVSVASLFGLLEMERKSGYLLVVREGETALLGFRDGRVVRADIQPELGGQVSGKEKVFYVLDWTEGRFEFVTQEVGAGGEIGMAPSHLLIEHAQIRDEAG